MSRTYDQYCPVARALELVGERWTLLVARELLLGPRRFTDLMAGLPGISANVLASRLKDLDQKGMVARRTLPPPAASAVYELTDHAAGLVSVLAAMADWGMTMLGEPRPEDEVRGEWILLGLAVTAAAPEVADGTTYERPGPRPQPPAAPGAGRRSRCRRPPGCDDPGRPGRRAPRRRRCASHGTRDDGRRRGRGAASRGVVFGASGGRYMITIRRDACPAPRSRHPRPHPARRRGGRRGCPRGRVGGGAVERSDRVPADPH